MVLVLHHVHQKRTGNPVVGIQAGTILWDDLGDAMTCLFEGVEHDGQAGHGRPTLGGRAPQLLHEQLRGGVVAMDQHLSNQEAHGRRCDLDERHHARVRR